MRAHILPLAIFPIVLGACDQPASAEGRPRMMVKKPPIERDVHALAGINFPPNQGNTRTGSFCRGPYDWDYSNSQIAAANGPFNAMRLPINEATASDAKALEKMKHYVDQFTGKHAIITMVDTSNAKYDHCVENPSQGNGIASAKVADAWAKIHAVFKDHPNVHYEIFNEPHGYDAAHGYTPRKYVEAMEAIIREAKLPRHRCILDGTGYADDIQAVAAAGWDGDLALHFYPSFVGKNRTQSNYSNAVQKAIGALGSRTWITEFGANLSGNNPCYDRYETPADDSKQGDPRNDIKNDINALRGLDDALRALRAHGHGVKGVFLWHGRDDQETRKLHDTYDFWNPADKQGACKVREILIHD